MRRGCHRRPMRHSMRRFSGGSHGFVVGHVTPEAFVGGPIAVVKNGDPIIIDAEKRAITLGIPAKELAARLKAWKQPKPRYTRGVLAKYAKLVSSASVPDQRDIVDNGARCV